MTLPLLRALQADVEVDVMDARVDADLGAGVYRYVSALVRLVDEGERHPGTALAEAQRAIRFLREMPRLPPARPWSPR